MAEVEQLITKLDRNVEEIILVAISVAFVAALFNYLPIVLFAGAVIASIAIRQNRRLAAERHALEFIIDYNTNDSINKSLEFIRGIDTKNLADDELWESYQMDRNKFLYLMNKLEILAIGWEHNVYDKEMIKKFLRKELFNVYHKSEKLIEFIRKREDAPRAFCEFQTLITEKLK